MAKLELWTKSDNYSGLDLSEYYIGPSKSRYSDILSQSNFDVALEQLGGESEDNGVLVGFFNHWGCGHFEQIFVHKDSPKVSILQEIADALDRYPILDDSDFHERERQEINDQFDYYKDDFKLNLIECFGETRVELAARIIDLDTLMYYMFDYAVSYEGLEDAYISNSLNKNTRLLIDLADNFQDNDSLIKAINILKEGT